MGKSEFILRINATDNFKEKFLLVTEAMMGDIKNIDSIENELSNILIKT